MHGFIYSWVKFTSLNKITKKTHIYDRRASELKKIKSNSMYFNTLKFILCYSKFDLLCAINIKQQEYYIHTFTHLAISVFLVPIPLNSLSEK